MIDLKQLHYRYREKVAKMMADYPSLSTKDDIPLIIVDFKIFLKDGEVKYETVQLKDPSQLNYCAILDTNCEKTLMEKSNPYLTTKARLIGYHNHLEGYERYIFQYDLQDEESYNNFNFNLTTLRRIIEIPNKEYFKLLLEQDIKILPVIRISKNIKINTSSESILELPIYIRSYIESNLTQEQLKTIAVLDIAINDVYSTDELIPKDDTSLLEAIITNMNTQTHVVQMTVIVTFTSGNLTNIGEIRESIVASLETLEMSNVYTVDNQYTHKFYNF